MPAAAVASPRLRSSSASPDPAVPGDFSPNAARPSRSASERCGAVAVVDAEVALGLVRPLGRDLLEPRLSARNVRQRLAVALPEVVVHPACQARPPRRRAAHPATRPVRAPFRSPCGSRARSARAAPTRPSSRRRSHARSRGPSARTRRARSAPGSAASPRARAGGSSGSARPRSRPRRPAGGRAAARRTRA